VDKEEEPRKIKTHLLNGKGICLNGLFPFPLPFSQSIAFNSS